MAPNMQQTGACLIDDNIDTSEICALDEAPLSPRAIAPRSPTDSAQPHGLAAVFSIPFKDGPQRFWEKAAAFWAISVIGVAAAATVTWLGWSAIGPVLSCAIACGLTAGVAASGAIRLQAPKARAMAAILLPAVLAAGVLCAVLLGSAHILLFMPSAAEIIMVSAVCYFGVYCTVSLLAPAGARERPAQWPHAAALALTNWHKAAGLVILTFVYLSAAPLAAVCIAASPAFFEKVLAARARKRHSAWLGHLAALSKMLSGADREEKLSAHTGVARLARRAARWAGGFLTALPAIVLGSWYAGLSTAALLLAQFGSAPLGTPEKE
ncbi:MAG: hypothetical protein HQ592_17690 [Planctomycetes bacterium]|nr:hypothetical protein [Planctomycetota bacterium]